MIIKVLGPKASATPGIAGPTTNRAKVTITPAMNEAQGSDAERGSRATFVRHCVAVETADNGGRFEGAIMNIHTKGKSLRPERKSPAADATGRRRCFRGQYLPTV